MLFKILPISNTAYILGTVHFQYPKLGFFSDMEYYFWILAYQDTKVPKRFVGVILISVLSPLTATGVNKMTPLNVGTSYAQNIGFNSKEKNYPPDCRHLECLIMLVMHSELHRGQRLHICDISPLRVNEQTF